MTVRENFEKPLFDNRKIYNEVEISSNPYLVHAITNSCLHFVTMDHKNGATEVGGVDEVFENHKAIVECDMGLETSEGDAFGKPGYSHFIF